MKNLLIPVVAATLLNVCIYSSANADNKLATDIQQLSHTWASITYEMPEATHSKQLGALNKQAKMLLKQNPDDENLLTWSGIISASYAGSRGGLGALKVVKQAKKHFEKAMTINPDAMDGGARTSLGALYYQVPGWPIGFGNSKKAEKLLSESYEKHPDNINTIYFYADFLLDQKRFVEAIKLFEIAAKIEPRSYAMVADEGRLLHINEKLKLLNKIIS